MHPTVTAFLECGGGALFIRDRLPQSQQKDLPAEDLPEHVIKVYAPTDQAMALLSSFCNVRGVQAGEAVTDHGLLHIAGMSSITDLILIGAQVTDAGLKHISCLNQLQSLDLTRTHVTDTGLMQLSGLKDLQWLVVCDTAVKEQGARHLQRCNSQLSIGLTNFVLNPE